MSATGERGFTLVEALVVVAVTALISAILFPAVDRSLTRLAAAQAQGALGVELAAARARAARFDAPAQIVVDADGRGYAATGGAHRALPAGLSLTASKPLTFFADGSSSGAVLSLGKPGRAAEIFAVDPVTGLVAPPPAAGVRP